MDTCKTCLFWHDVGFATWLPSDKDPYGTRYGYCVHPENVSGVNEDTQDSFGSKVGRAIHPMKFHDDTCALYKER